MSTASQTPALSESERVLDELQALLADAAPMLTAAKDTVQAEIAVNRAAVMRMIMTLAVAGVMAFMVVALLNGFLLSALAIWLGWGWPGASLAMLLANAALLIELRRRLRGLKAYLGLSRSRASVVDLVRAFAAEAS